MNWWKLAKFDVRVTGLSEDDQTISLNIEGRPYTYKLPWPYFPKDVAADLQKRRGTALSKYVKWLDRFLVKEDENREEGPDPALGQLPLWSGGNSGLHR